ncbi:MAG: PD40 domain-containing protein [Acidobacteriota bacterium]|nr:MAG: PD40 domain-containing protein [Acidobacteriota bacterium]
MKLISALRVLSITLLFLSLTFPQSFNPTRLTNVRNSYPHPSADGSKIVFQSNRTGRNEIFVMNSDGSGVKQITDGPGASHSPKFSPNGSKIAFAGYVDGNSDIYTMNADGSGRERLTEHPGDDSHPSWSSDGRRIVFNSARTTPDLSVEWQFQIHEIFSIAADGSDLRQHTRCKSVCTYGSLSPDGKRIAYRKTVNAPGFLWDLSPTQRNSEAFVADAEGGNEKNLSQNAAFDGWPVWMPDSQRIIFTSNRAGPAFVGHLYLINIDGTGLRKLTTGSWSYVQASVSVDGKKVYAFQNEEREDYEFGDVVEIPLNIEP